MNKISMTGLILGLILLGILFFFTGFLVASTFNEQQKIPLPLPAVSSWDAANQSQMIKGGQSRQGTKPQENSSFAKGMTAGGVSGLASSIIGGAVSRFGDHTDTSSYSGGGASASSILSQGLQRVPPGLRPFAIQAYNQSVQKMSGGVNRAADQLQGPFRPRPYGNVPPPVQNQSPQQYQRPVQTRPPFAPRQSQRQLQPQSPYVPHHQQVPQQPFQQDFQPLPPPVVYVPVPQYPTQYPSEYQYPSQGQYPYYPPQSPPQYPYGEPVETQHPSHPPYPQQWAPQPIPQGYAVPQPYPPQPPRFVPMG